MTMALRAVAMLAASLLPLSAAPVGASAGSPPVQRGDAGASPGSPPVRRGDAEATIQVSLLERAAPRALMFTSRSARLHVMAVGSRLSADGREVDALSLPMAEWKLLVPGEPPRRYHAALDIGVRNGRLVIRAEMPIEDYVARVVATESSPGTPQEALRALAVVARSYALAGAPRHEGAAVCDLAHCQAMQGEVSEARLAPARRAAEATRGETLRLRDGRVARALFTAACGGHTSDPAQVFGGENETGALPVPDPGCQAPWTASLTRRQFESAYQNAFGVVPPRDLRAADLLLVRGAGDFVRTVIDRPRRLATLGDRFARALDSETRFRAVRSSRFSITDHAGGVTVRGKGIGHGAGLCQAGATRMARSGEGYETILERFFSGARLEKAWQRGGFGSKVRP